MEVKLLASMGDDLTIVNAARVSYAKESTWLRDDDGLRIVKSLREADVGLIGYLMRNHHGTPFEMVQFQFRIRVPIGVAREWQRHRIGSFNEVSTRYVEMKADFYVPEPHAVRSQAGKPGYYEMVTMDLDAAEVVRETFMITYDMAYKAYKDLLAQGVAKELARNVLPLGLMTEFYWSVNLRSLFNFLMLRNADTALLEIHMPAREVEQLAQDVVPHAFEAFNSNKRVAP